MAGAREGSRLAKGLARGPLTQRTSTPCVRRFASTQAEKPASQPDALAELDPSSSFSSPAPDSAAIEAFKNTERKTWRENKLPGNRYQYHPPKYYRGPLHPVQMPKSSDPIARDFVPGPFNFPRLKHTYDSTIAPDLLTLTYKHVPPGTPPSTSQKGLLREWDGSSPYHKNRPRRGPRGGGSSRLGLLERDLDWTNLPEIKAVSIHAFTPNATENKEYLTVARAAIQAISGQFPRVTKVKNGVVQWHIRKGDKTGVKTTLKGAAALEFVDKLVTIVLPKIKDWPGLKASTGDDSGNLALGLKPEWMSFFPELEFNYDVFPVKMVPGCDIFIQTTATSDRQGRLLLEALGFPFYGKLKH
ncbi:ribosomal protein L5 domain-containing protein [Stachybotrys elegans]|uniref:Ribosomal protein L5 domain-containing protein n=1 Tax=Stachybotrys elegans TaxID=80388 RepID=A0A8K0WRA2_9HYPO|nr:ribosomal protein L5 domain-containing protein [Stachybotrys elegans]